MPLAAGSGEFLVGESPNRANMLKCAFRETGLAVARSNSGKLYWTETFGG
ncbi:MAG: CAP domain-containing protein [Pseudonocardiaceae bacterium]